MYVIHQPGGLYQENLCPMSWILPNAEGNTQDRGDSFPQYEQT